MHIYEYNEQLEKLLIIKLLGTYFNFCDNECQLFKLLNDLCKMELLSENRYMQVIWFVVDVLVWKFRAYLNLLLNYESNLNTSLLLFSSPEHNAPNVSFLLSSSVRAALCLVTERLNIFFN